MIRTARAIGAVVALAAAGLAAPAANAALPAVATRSAETALVADDVELIARCNAGERVVGGGFELPKLEVGAVNVVASQPVSGTAQGWRVVAVSKITGAKLRATAVCAEKSDALVTSVTSKQIAPPGDDFELNATCPAGRYPLGGGFHLGGRGFSAVANVSEPGANGWRTVVSLTPGSTAGNVVTAVAVCGKLAGVATAVKSAAAALAGGSGKAAAGCSKGQRALGGGFHLGGRGLQLQALTTTRLNTGAGGWGTLAAAAPELTQNVTSHVVCLRELTAPQSSPPKVIGRSATVALGADDDFEVTAGCKTGERVVGGGFELPQVPVGTVNVVVSEPSVGTVQGWRVVIVSKATAGTLKVVAVCVPKTSALTTTIVRKDIAPPGDNFEVNATCPSGRYPLGGGFHLGGRGMNAVANVSQPGANGWRTVVSLVPGSTAGNPVTSVAVCGKLTGLATVVRSAGVAAAGGNGKASVTCSSGQKVLGGGFHLGGRGLQLQALATLRSGTAGWAIAAATAPSLTPTVSSHAVCLKAAQPA